MPFEVVERDGRWLIAAGPIEFGPYADAGRAAAAAREINLNNATRSLTASAAPSPLVLVKGGKASRR